MRKILKAILPAFAGLALLAGCSDNKSAQAPAQQYQGKKIKAGFVYVGPVGDYGWSNAHEQGRLYVQKKFPWLESVYVENVDEAGGARVIDRLINEEKCDVVFTSSFGYMDATLAAAKKYPNKIFMHCSGFKRDKNMGTYFADFSQLYYLNGLMAGALTKSGKIGYVAAHPVPEVIRHINAFSLGIREVNPKVKVSVKWLYSWYDPAKAREAAESLITEGADVLAFTEDSPSVIQAGQEHTAKGHPVYTFSHYSPMQKFGPDSAVSGQMVDWGIMYEDILSKIYAGAWNSADWWWLVREKAVILGGEPGQPINPKIVDKLKAFKVKDSFFGDISIYDLVNKRLEQMSDPAILFDPFTGPIKDQSGNIRLKAGQRAPLSMLMSMDWFVDSVSGSMPKK